MHVTGNVLTALFVIIVGLGGLGALRFNALKTANETIKSMQARIGDLETRNEEVLQKCADLEQRCQVLTELVTNAAAVGTLADSVREGHDRILARLDDVVHLVAPDKKG